MSVLKIKDASGNWVGVTAIKGEKGEAGVSPKIHVTANNSTTYKLRIETEEKEFITPNLKGQGGTGGGNVSSELGTIDNYKKLDGENIPAYNMDLPPLPCFEGGTRYAFERPVTMLVYVGEPDENDNYDIDKYLRIDAVLNETSGVYEVSVPTEKTGTITDYVIYNPIPKKEWDTWANPNLVNVLDVTDRRIGCRNRADGLYWLPNNKNSVFNSGDAWISYYKYKDAFDKDITRPGDYQIAVYDRKSFPFILDEPVLFYEYDPKEKIYKEPVEVKYPSPQWTQKINDMPAFKVGNDYTLEDVYLGACGEEEGWGNSVIMRQATRIKEQNLLEGREWDLVIASPSTVNNHLMEHGAKPLAPAMYVGLKPLNNYTIESTAGDCALVLSNNITNHFVTKETEVCYPSTIKSVVVKKSQAQDVGTGNGGGAFGGTVTGGSKLENGTVLHFNVVDTSADPVGMMEIPTYISCPTVYLKRGESYTFQVEDEDDMYGIWVMCLDEEDYKGIKIVEGIQPYSELMAERMASGATKFNVKVYADNFDDNEIMAEYNIRLCENTTDDSYCRFLTNNTIKHFDLDDFSMNGHTHDIEKMEGVEELKATIPKMVLSTATLADGESELAENTFHFVYKR